MGCQRSRFHLGVLLAGLHPRDLTPGAPPADSVCFRSPSPPFDLRPELCYSDDRRLFARSADGLAHLLSVVCHGCWAAGGSVNGDKLLAFRIGLRSGRMVYVAGSCDTVVGTVRFSKGGLQLAGVPLLTGAFPSEAAAKSVQRLGIVTHAFRRLSPPFILALRIVLGFGVARLDYVFDAMPVAADRLRESQRAVDNALLTSLQLPRSAARALLYTPLPSGGFGFPHLADRAAVRFVCGLLRLLDCRSVLAVRLARWLLVRPGALRVDGDDLSVARAFLPGHAPPPHTPPLDSNLLRTGDRRGAVLARGVLPTPPPPAHLRRFPAGPAFWLCDSYPQTSGGGPPCVTALGGSHSPRPDWRGARPPASRHGLSVVLLPDARVSAARELRRTDAAYVGGDVLLISDGSCCSGAVGWGAVVVGPGGVLGTASGGCVCAGGSSWVAEWLGKLAAVMLALSLGVPVSSLTWSIADNMAAILGPDGGPPGRGGWPDAVRLEFARLTQLAPLQEAFVPAEHDSRWSCQAAGWQASCHDLAAAGVAGAARWSCPFPSVLAGCALLFKDGHLVADVRTVLDGVYAGLHPTPAHLMPLSSDAGCLLSWRAVVCGGLVPSPAHPRPPVPPRPFSRRACPPPPRPPPPAARPAALSGEASLLAAGRPADARRPARRLPLPVVRYSVLRLGLPPAGVVPPGRRRRPAWIPRCSAAPPAVRVAARLGYVRVLRRLPRGQASHPVAAVLLPSPSAVGPAGRCAPSGHPGLPPPPRASSTCPPVPGSLFAPPRRRRRLTPTPTCRPRCRAPTRWSAGPGWSGSRAPA